MLTTTPHPTRPLRIHRLTYLEDNGDVVVGRTDIDSYGVFPPDGAALLRELASGVPPEQAAAWYEQTYGEPVDLAEFIGVLEELDFLQDERTDDPQRPPRWQRLGRWMFSPLAGACYLLLVLLAVAAMVDDHRLVPRTTNLFFTRHLSLIAITLFLGQMPLLLLHESFHALAGRRLGLRSTLRVGRRLHFLVLETSLDGLVVLPRGKRYLPMLAGMLADTVAIAVLTLVAWGTLDAGSGAVAEIGDLCRTLAFAALLRFVWQFYFYLRTDLYYVVVTVLGCHDLHAAARWILRGRVRRLLGRTPLPGPGPHPRDLSVGRWYSWLMVVGYTFSIGTLALVVVPAFIRGLDIAFGRFGGGAHPWWEIADSSVFLLLTFGQFAVVGYLALRSRRAARRAARPATARPATA